MLKRDLFKIKRQSFSSVKEYSDSFQKNINIPTFKHCTSQVKPYGKY